MPLFKISQGVLEQIRICSFQKEKDIQSITEKNVEVIFGLQFVCSELTISKFRLDTVCFDPETKSFVIIEYKIRQDFSIIDQGYAYLSIMLNHKADFVLKYNEITKGNSTMNYFDWSQTRVLFVSPSFTPYQIQAINFKDLPIELWEVHQYADTTIRYNKIEPYQHGASIGSLSNPNNIKKVDSEITVFSEVTFLNDVDEEVREAYSEIKNIVHQINADVTEKVKKTMVCFYSGGKGLLWMKPTKNKITLWLRKGRYKDKSGKFIKEGWGNYPELTFSAEEIDMNFIYHLIELANNLEEDSRNKRVFPEK